MVLLKLSEVSSVTFLRQVMPVARCVLCFHQTALVTCWDFGWCDRVDKLNERFFLVRHRIGITDVIANNNAKTQSVVIL
jgi:hypothetical protein